MIMFLVNIYTKLWNSNSLIRIFPICICQSSGCMFKPQRDQQSFHCLNKCTILFTTIWLNFRPVELTGLRHGVNEKLFMKIVLKFILSKQVNPNVTILSNLDFQNPNWQKTEVIDNIKTNVSIVRSPEQEELKVSNRCIVLCPLTVVCRPSTSSPL